MSSKFDDESLVMNLKSDNIEIMFKDKPDKVIEELFQLLISRHQFGLAHQWKVVISYLIVFIYCIANIKK